MLGVTPVSVLRNSCWQVQGIIWDFGIKHRAVMGKPCARSYCSTITLVSYPDFSKGDIIALFFSLHTYGKHLSLFHNQHGLLIKYFGASVFNLKRF